MVDLGDTFLLSTLAPEPSEYCALRESVGLSPKDVTAASEALPRSVFCVTIRDGRKLIAMGRIVGDKGCFVQIVDIMVDAQYQKRGLSRRIMEALMQYIDREIPKCAIVSLFADIDWLYQKFGFAEPLSSKGMLLKR